MSKIRATFPKAEKLKSKQAISYLFKQGKYLHHSPIRAIYAIKDTEETIKVAVSVPKKNIRLAVNRNLIKRRIREAYRLHNQDLKAHLKNKNLGLEVMFIYTGKQICSYQEIEPKIKLTLKRLMEQHEVVDK